MKPQLIAVANGTQWLNIVPDSEDLSNGWTLLGANHGDLTTINSIGGHEIISTNTNTLLRNTTGPNLYTANDMFVGAFVRSGLATWCSMSISATNGVGAAQGGETFFNLSTPAVGSFVAINSGTQTDAGIRVYADGVFCWAVVDCQGDDTFGATVAFRPATADGDHTSPNDSVNASISLAGCMVVDGPTGEIQYVST